MVIDSHQHFWRYDPERYAWIGEEDRVLRRDFQPADLEAVLTRNGVDGTVVVQARAELEETDRLLELAEANDWIRGVVGWVDLTAEDVADQLDRYADRPKLRGIRMMVQGEEDPLYMLRPAFLRGMETLFRRGYTYDLLIYPHQLGQALELVRLFPRGRFVIDHLAKPYIKHGWRAGWAIGIRALGRRDNCYCKLSGMVTEADHANWTPADLRPYLDALFDAFAPEQLMFGSDWPVCLLATDYADWKRLVEGYLMEQFPAHRDRVMGGTAASFYGLTDD
jgi:L-fuconolactonase